MTAIQPVEIRRAAMDLLARREHSQQELRERLLRRFAEPDLVEQAIAQLAEEGLQSDERFAESFVRSRIARRHGPVRIRQELKQKGIDSLLATQALEAQEVDWFAQLCELSENKYGDQPPADQRERAKRQRFFQYRGFDYDTIASLLAEW